MIFWALFTEIRTILIIALITGNTSNTNISKTNLILANNNSPKEKELIDILSTNDKIDINNDNNSNNENSPAFFKLKKAI